MVHSSSCSTGLASGITDQAKDQHVNRKKNPRETPDGNVRTNFRMIDHFSAGDAIGGEGRTEKIETEPWPTRVSLYYERALNIL